jgi:hypothetical protein
MAAATSHGLAFSISPAKKQHKKKTEDEEEHILTLAPFTKPPKISFGQVKVNELVERNVLISNPQHFPIDLVISNQELNINNLPVSIEANSTINLSIKWQPDLPNNYKYAIVVECMNTARFKFIIHAYGICLKPEVKKPVRKPLNSLQPLKKETSSKTASVIAKQPQTANQTVVKQVLDETVVLKETKSAMTTTKVVGNENASKTTLTTTKTVVSHQKKAIYNASHLYGDVDKTPKNEPPVSMFTTACQADATPKFADFIKQQPQLPAVPKMMIDEPENATLFLEEPIDGAVQDMSETVNVATMSATVTKAAYFDSTISYEGASGGEAEMTYVKSDGFLSKTPYFNAADLKRKVIVYFFDDLISFI